MVKRTLTRRSVALAGEDIKTEHWEDARHWLSVYADLLQFKVGLLARVAQDIPKLPPAARNAASEDLAIIEEQMEGYQQRLDLWYRRVWDLQGLWIDPDGRVVRHRGREAALTRREYQLLNFLIEHPHRYYSAAQILDQAWADPALFPEEVRNYVQRIRKILKQLDIPAQVLNRPKRGYSLVFDGSDRGNGTPSSEVTAS
jgi:DNA-binding winged helix-turn-helix (wHTH) protein